MVNENHQKCVQGIIIQKSALTQPHWDLWIMSSVVHMQMLASFPGHSQPQFLIACSIMTASNQ